MRSKEWSDKGYWSSFNSIKGLTYIDHYRGVIAGKLLPPIEASIDPAALCQLSCDWCNAYSYLDEKGSLHESVESRIIPRDVLLRLVDFLCGWGVRGICFGGGGDPSLSSNTHEAIWLAGALGVETAMITNGIQLDSDLMDAMLQCRWVGFSVDAGNRETYHRMKGKDRFDLVYYNISELVQRRQKSGSETEISYKMIVVPDNVNDIIPACKTARSLGVDVFHVRPPSFEGREVFQDKELDYDVDNVMLKFSACHEMETDQFRVVTSYHKSDQNFRKKNDFELCIASALQIQCCADGNVYVCQDVRIRPEFRLGSYSPDPRRILEFWGGERHLEILRGIRPEDCVKCTYSPYNKQAEEVCVRDSLMVNFP
jgi:MoaA/NifB/PqqE/SkfB family radical SAM enzyme